MKLTEVYTTYDWNGKIINTVDFEGKDFDSVPSAYAECIEHDVNCLKAGNAKIIEVCCNHIHYMMDGERFEDEVMLYDEDGNRVQYPID